MILSKVKVTCNLIEISFIKTACLETLEVLHLIEIIQIQCLDVLITALRWKNLRKSKKSHNLKPFPRSYRKQSQDFVLKKKNKR